MIFSKGQSRIWDFTGGKFHLGFKSMGCRAGLHSTDATVSCICTCAHLHSLLLLLCHRPARYGDSCSAAADCASDCCHTTQINSQVSVLTENMRIRPELTEYSFVSKLRKIAYIICTLLVYTWYSERIAGSTSILPASGMK